MSTECGSVEYAPMDGAMLGTNRTVAVWRDLCGSAAHQPNAGAREK